MSKDSRLANVIRKEPAFDGPRVQRLRNASSAPPLADSDSHGGWRCGRLHGRGRVELWIPSRFTNWSIFSFWLATHPCCITSTLINPPSHMARTVLFGKPCSSQMNQKSLRKGLDRVLGTETVKYMTYDMRSYVRSGWLGHQSGLGSGQFCSTQAHLLLKWRCA